ncbi:hypothetical protein [Brevibacillus borstelensis]|uniref:hypothetical protein n=1 Tax=Brevibacillus borstelensis TaxID=45462 RepID=UPI0030C3CDF1
MKRLLSSKVVVPAASALTLLAFTMPAFAYSSVTATASITFSESSSYYRAIGKGTVKPNGDVNKYQRIENRTILQNNASWRSISSDTDNKTVTVTITSDKEGDDLYWVCSVDGELWDGDLIDEDSDKVTKKYAFRP